jgi:hypothetical protein
MASISIASSADAQRRGGGMRGGGMRPGAGGAGTRMNFPDSNRHVRRDANTSINYNRNVNVNRNLNVDVDVHHAYGYGWYGGYHPIARAAIATAAVATTAAIVGSYYRSLPTNCAVVYRVGLTYYQCGSVWYQPSYVGSSIQYVVVTAP